MPYRQLVGFLLSIFTFMKVALKIPHFTTVAARAKLLNKHIRKLFKSSPTDLVLDSNGFKIYGEEKIRQYGKQKRRRWKKFHIGVHKRMKRTIGDGAYDTWDCYKGAYEKGQQLIVPPREGAVFNDDEESWRQARNDAICQIYQRRRSLWAYT